MLEDRTEFRKLAAIMFTDMVGYSAMAQRNEALAIEFLEEHRAIVRPILSRHQGDEIKTMGDAFLVEFPSALSAVRCAVEIQKEIAERNSRTSPDRLIQLRIGIHLGDIVRRENDVMGDGVNIAARIEPMARPGGICISEDVARQIQNKVDQNLIRMGPGELKNIQLPVVIYKLEPHPANATGGFSGKSIRPPTLPEQLRELLISARVAFLMAILLILVVVGFLTWGRSSTPNGPSVAVLPLVSVSTDRQNEVMTDGLTGELISALARLPGLHVPSSTATFGYKGRTDQVRTIGRELQVQHLLEGSVRKDGTELRITLQLIKVSDGFNVWSKTFDESGTNTFQIQSRVSEQASRAVRDILMPEEAVGGIGALRASRER